MTPARGQQLPPAILLRGVIFWSRVHGLISLELDRHLASMQLDAELLYRAELAELGGRLSPEAAAPRRLEAVSALRPQPDVAPDR